MMRRGYTRRDYLEKIRVIRSARKHYSVTGDIIVGFPGETEQDFQDTMSLVAETQYDGLYIFKYSSRPKTAAAAFEDSVPEEVKTDRFLKLQELQSNIQRTLYKRYLGREFEVLVEDRSARSEFQFTGHTKCQKVVNFDCRNSSLGDLVKVLITQSHPHSLSGDIVDLTI
jgi:tRNA-2-methylthio-N6-dimethylallyladenosine synthase